MRNTISTGQATLANGSKPLTEDSKAILLLLSVPEAHVMNQDVVDDLPEVLAA
jgi:hypothetical protein